MSEEKPPLDWSLVKAYVAGVFTVTIFNRYMFLGGLIGVFTGINSFRKNLRLKFYNTGIYAQQQYSSSIPDVHEIWENIKETIKNSQSEAGKKK